MQAGKLGIQPCSSVSSDEVLRACVSWTSGLLVAYPGSVLLYPMGICPSPARHVKYDSNVR